MKKILQDYFGVETLLTTTFLKLKVVFDALDRPEFIKKAPSVSHFYISYELTVCVIPVSF